MEINDDEKLDLVLRALTVNRDILLINGSDIRPVYLNGEQQIERDNKIKKLNELIKEIKNSR